MATDDSTLPAVVVVKPATVERYVLVAKLGEGAMGVVWSARDTALDRNVAIKLLNERFLGGDYQVRLAGEARAMARLSHPNVVAVYDVGERDGRTFVAMELVRGVTFARWLETPHTWREVVEIVRGAAAGLAAAHAAGIVHRDVKPTNILVGDDGRARVADFGVAHAAALLPPPGADVVATTTGLIGSPAYMSMEQLCGEPSDTRADQFGLCVTLYEALHGKRPWGATSVGALVHEIMHGVPPPVRPVPRWLHRVVERGLAAAPADRFSSMAALSRALSGPRRRIPIAIAGIAIAGGVAVAVAAASSPLAAPSAGSDTPTWAKEKTEFMVVLKHAGANKSAVVEVVREVTGLDLDDATNLVENAPKVVKAGVNKAEAREIERKLREAGAKVKVK